MWCGVSEIFLGCSLSIPNYDEDNSKNRSKLVIRHGCLSGCYSRKRYYFGRDILKEFRSLEV